MVNLMYLPRVKLFFTCSISRSDTREYAPSCKLYIRFAPHLYKQQCNAKLHRFGSGNVYSRILGYAHVRDCYWHCCC